MGRGAEAEEREIIVQEVAAPDGKGIENVQRHVANVPYRHHPLPETQEHFFHLIIY